MSLVLQTDGRSYHAEPRNGRAFVLDELQAIVGGYIEAVYFDNGEIMFVNEDGQRLQLPVNDAATVLVRTQARYRGEWILGNVIVCSRIEAGEDERER